ncbi:hypothetical protein [Clostridium sp. BSD9I1]|uniref:hypothetical protein n=1 Tax=Clostridium sp. BSD9I1 TaxID=2003589 RepID=UPI00164534DB|nr:hypothetical protein [Clostridium sp. BSD9I1]
MELGWALGILIIVFVYEKVRRPIVCKRKIYSHINNIGGKINSIEKLTLRDEVYSVYYTVDGQSSHLTVKFNIFYESIWT